MTSSSPSDDPAGFSANHKSERIPLAGPFVSDMAGPLGGVFLHDMPVGRPVRPKPKIKGVPGPTTGADSDYLPGQGTWSDAT